MDQQEEGKKMERKMFGHRMRKVRDDEEVPGHGENYMDNEDDQGGRATGNPPNYEGREHVRYKNPGFSSHHIRYPEDEPHMKSHVTPDEEHEMEDDYHMGIPDQTAHSLAKRIPRAHMLMDAPNQQDPKPVFGSLVEKVGKQGKMEESGIERMGPHDMQGSDGHDEMPKEHRKKMIVEVMKRKMKKSR